MKPSRLGGIVALAGALCVAGVHAQPAEPRAPAVSQASPATAAGATPAPGGPARAAEAPIDPATEPRLRALLDELRCLVCQNQTLADSNADLAVDLRNEVRQLFAQGRSDAQIKSYLVERYGDFVLYRPPVQRNTWLLWFGPFALLAVGAIAWAGIARASRARRPARPASDEDLARGRRLIED